MCEPLSSQTDIVENVVDYVKMMLTHPEALRGQQLRGGGPVSKFEMLLTERTGFPHCLATSSATSALLVAGLALELTGKQIAVETGAWKGSISSLRTAGVKILKVESLLTMPLKNVAAVLATDRPGARHNAREIRDRCDQAGIRYIEDTGWLPGVTAPKDQLSLADVQVISFGPGKPISVGEGGALLCRGKRLYDLAVAISQHPERIQSEKISASNFPCLNARIHPIAAILGTHLLHRFSRSDHRRGCSQISE